eukprot:1401832-Rhodomonas_salina.1
MTAGKARGALGRRETVMVETAPRTREELPTARSSKAGLVAARSASPCMRCSAKGVGPLTETEAVTPGRSSAALRSSTEK